MGRLFDDHERLPESTVKLEGISGSSPRREGAAPTHRGRISPGVYVGTRSNEVV